MCFLLKSHETKTVLFSVEIYLQSYTFFIVLVPFEIFMLLSYDKGFNRFLCGIRSSLFFPIKSYGLIEVDITRGNLNPLPLAVSPLSIDENSRKSFEKILKI